MGYENPNRIKHSAGVADIGAGTKTFYFRGPKGKAGRLHDYGIEAVSEQFTNTTTAATLEVGTAADQNAYGTALDLGTLAVTDAKSVRQTYDENADKASFDALMVDRNIPADTPVRLTCTAPTGGTPAGIGMPWLMIDWDP